MPIERITMMNYGFGDCFLAEGFDRGDDSKMMVDCGSLAQPSNLGEVIQETARQFFSGGGERSLVVTHLHSDHFGQLKNLVPLSGGRHLDAVYMPNMFEPKIIAVSFLVMRLLAQKDAPEIYEFYHTVLTSLFDISGLLDNSTMIYMLDRRNIRFENGLGDFRILWPDMDFLKPIWDEPLPEGFEDRVSAAYRQYIEGFFTPQSSNGRDNEGGETFQYKGERPTEDDLEKKIKEIAGEKGKEEKLTDAQQEKLTRLANNYSLVFDEETYWYRRNGCIFFGDATPRVVEHIRGDLKPRYSVVKVPHHGTPNYRSPYLPDGDIYLIPFGERKGYALDDAYFWRTTSLSFTRMVLSRTLPCPFYYDISQKIDVVSQVSIAVTLF